MANSLRASKQKLEIVERARRMKGWNKDAIVWADAAGGISTSTLKRFWMGKLIRQDNFAAICRAVGVENWQEIVDDSSVQVSEPNEISEITWLLVLSANINEINRPRAQAIIEHLKQLLDEPSLTLKRIDNGSVVLVLSGSQEGFEWFQYLFRSGDITEILGIPVEDVRLANVNLRQWLQNDLVEAIQEGWQTISDIFGSTRLIPAFRSDTIKRAKHIQLGERILALILQLNSVENQEIRVLVGVYSNDNQTYLPQNLNISVLSESREKLVEILVPSNSDGFIQELFFSEGESFYIQISFDNFSYAEEFVV